MTRSDKAAIIEAIRQRAERASFMALTDFKGMTVEELTGLRNSLRKAGGEYCVVKNTLAKIAISSSSHATIKDKLRENCGVVLAYEDPVPVAKALSDFAKQSKLFRLRCASLNGREMVAAQIEELAKLPPREQLLARLLGTMNAVPTQFVSLFANIQRGLLYALKAIEEQKKNAA